MLKILVITTPFQFYSQQLNYLNVSSVVKMNIFQFTNILLPLEQFCFHYLSLPIMCIKNQNPHKVIPNQSSGVRYYLLIFLSSLTRETMYILIVKIYSVIYIYIYILKLNQQRSIIFQDEKVCCVNYSVSSSEVLIQPSLKLEFML